MPVTLRQVAQQLKLSQSLVSGVLNDRPGVWASEDTRRRVRHAAREMGYQPSAAARALCRGKTGAIAFVHLYPPSPFARTGFSSVVEALAGFLNARDHDLILKVLPEQAQVLAELSRLARARACDAFILWGSEEETEPQGRLLDELGCRFVVKGRHEEKHPAWLQVDFDHEAMMDDVIAHLAALGHRRIAFLGYEADAPFRHYLEAGYHAALERLVGCPAPPAYIARGNGSTAWAEAQTARWLLLPGDERPTALAMACDNRTWHGVELALDAAGRRIGDSLSNLEFAVAGQSSGPDLKLLFGQGHAFHHLELFELARAMTERLVPALLSGEPAPQPTLRVHPALRSVDSFRLRERDKPRSAPPVLEGGEL